MHVRHSPPLPPLQLQSRLSLGLELAIKAPTTGHGNMPRAEPTLRSGVSFEGKGKEIAMGSFLLNHPVMETDFHYDASKPKVDMEINDALILE